MPIGALRMHKKAKHGVIPEPCEPIFGGYANGRGQISLFAETIVYRINFKLGTVQARPPLNSGAQARYEATGLGETFQYGNVLFRRLSSDEIIEICSSGSFRVMASLLS